jgi:hypothetical protein
MAQEVSAGLSSWWPGFAPESVHVGYVAVEQFFLSKFFGFPLSIPFHRGSILIYHLKNEPETLGGHNSET